MTNLSNFLAGQRRYCRKIALLSVFLALALSACVETGDFGRRKPSFFSGKSAFDPAPELIASSYSLTADESELRARATRFQKPPRAPVWGNFEVLDDWSGSDGNVYYGRLAGLHDQSPRARYRRLQSDIAADTAMIAPFRVMACRVEKADRRRLALRDAVSLPENESAAFAARLDENVAIIADVEARMRARSALYHASLERLRLASPDDEEAGIAPLLATLDREIAASVSCT